MTRRQQTTFPELRRVFSGYLHEDVLAEAGSPERALRTFWTDAAPEERRRFQHEVEQFLAQTAVLDLEHVRDLVRRLGCRWVPPSLDALVDLLTSTSWRQSSLRDTPP